MTFITRFAPSPTGYLHVGNARTALICYMMAKANGGKFMLRLDDTDIERSREEYSIQIQQDLKWLGLDWDIFARQSERINRYEEIKQILVKQGRMYPCYETPEEIEIKRKIQLGRGLPPIYDRAALKLTEAEKAKFQSEGRKPHWRFKLDETATIAWQDLIRGEIRFEAKNLSDPVLIRESGAPTYMLPSSVDDIDFAISNIVRGEDHITNTAIQIQIFEALGAKLPQFAHTSLIKNKSGKISKREGGYDIVSLNHDGIEAMAINSLLARIGTSEPIEPRTNMQELIDGFHISTMSKGAAIYDPEELNRLNAKILHITSYKQIKDRPDMQGVDEEFWLSVRANLTKLKDIGQWRNICREKLSPVIDDQDYTVTACTLLPEGKWDSNTWDEWIKKVKENTGRKGKDLFMPLRKALTARETGPELKDILPLIGRERAVARLNGKAA